MAVQSTDYRLNKDLFSNYYLSEHLPETEAWNQVNKDELRSARQEILELWEDEQDTAPKRNESQLEEKFIRPMFRILGIPFEVEETVQSDQRRPDYGFFKSEDDAKDAYSRKDEGGDFYKNAIAVADAKRWGRSLDTRGESQEDYTNPSFQIDQYLRKTETSWGVLTTGEKWRLYLKTTSHKLDSYYEVDLPTILEEGDLDDFKYFYLFFHHDAFVPDASGDTFLDDVYNESNVFAQELGEDLQDNIYEAINVLAEGFLQYPENDLNQRHLDQIHSASLIYLYRLIFILYAEAEGRELLDTDNSIYEQSYSLNSLKQEVAEERDSANPRYRVWQDEIWEQLDELFKLIDQGSQSRGIPKDDLYIPAYNGGLFNTDPFDSANDREKPIIEYDDDEFLATHKVGDSYLAEVIDLLTRSQNGNAGGKIFVDYSSLDIRHLGSIYEGLLEYQLNIADEPLAVQDGEYVVATSEKNVVVETGDLYLTTDSGERKVTGSYYTPEYVVTFIVENSLRPLVEEIREDLIATERYDERGFANEFAERIFELKILDPAMGSGHFLTSAVDFLAREIIDAQEKQLRQNGDTTDIDERKDIYWARRQIAQRCIYGVDLNPLAVELAKVSLWLRTLAAEQPLAFLDHHLKTGNSLVGSDIEDVLDTNDDDLDVGQLTLQQSFARTRQQALEHITERFQDLLAIDNETLEDIKEMEEVYEQAREDSLFQHLLSMANVHTASQFGVNVPDDADERMAKALRDDNWSIIEDQSWYINAQEIASSEKFFHWELEFPIVFYDVEGTRRSDSGFDAVVGNPPYVRIQNLKKTNPTLVTYLDETYLSTHQNYDLAVPFTELGYNLLREEGIFGFIETKKWLQGEYGEKLREFLVNRQAVHEIVDFGDQQVFPSASTYTILLFLRRGVDSDFRYSKIYNLEKSLDQLQEIYSQGEFVGEDSYSYFESFDNLDASPWVFTLPGEREILDELEKFDTLGDITDEIFQGIITGADPIYILKVEDVQGDLLKAYSKELDDTIEIEKSITKPLLRGKNISKWCVSNYEHRVIFPYHTNPKKGEYSLYSESKMEKEFPKTWNYLNTNKERLVDRSGIDPETWWQYGRPQNLEKFEDTKLMTQVLASESSFAIDEGGEYVFVGGGNAGGYGVVTSKHVEIDYEVLLAILNSNLLEWQLKKESSQFRGGYYSYARRFIEKLAICTGKVGNNRSSNTPTSHSDFIDELSTLVDEIVRDVQARRKINTNLPDYLGNFEWGETLGDVAGYQPAGGVSGTELSGTSTDYENLRVGSIKVNSDNSSVVIEMSARYKPEDEEQFETDRWGYTETELFPAVEFIGVSEHQKTLIEEFVPFAVQKAGGYADFRETATKSQSLVDRLNQLTLPQLNDVSDDIDRYVSSTERAKELEEAITNSESKIDEIIYELCEIDREQQEVIEKSLSNNRHTT